MAASSLRILYVDDSEIQLADVERALSRQGHSVVTALTLRDARAHVANADLVMVDFHMPEVNGAEALSVLRRHAREDLPVLFYLYTSDREVALSFKAYGFDGAFIGKGEVDSLVGQIDAANRLLQLKRFRHERRKA